MNTPTPLTVLHATLDDGLLSLDSLCRVTAVPPGWVIERVEAGLLSLACANPLPSAREQWRFDAVALRRVRQMRHYEQHFDAVPELAALVSDLLDEIAMLRALQGRLTRP